MDLHLVSMLELDPAMSEVNKHKKGLEVEAEEVVDCHLSEQGSL